MLPLKPRTISPFEFEQLISHAITSHGLAPHWIRPWRKTGQNNVFKSYGMDDYLGLSLEFKHSSPMQNERAVLRLNLHVGRLSKIPAMATDMLMPDGGRITASVLYNAEFHLNQASMRTYTPQEADSYGEMFNKVLAAMKHLNAVLRTCAPEAWNIYYDASEIEDTIVNTLYRNRKELHHKLLSDLQYYCRHLKITPARTKKATLHRLLTYCEKHAQTELIRQYESKVKQQGRPFPAFTSLGSSQLNLPTTARISDTSTGYRSSDPTY
jgi:hypothetical protein